MIAPQLRFKDVDGQNFPEWEEATLGEVCDIKRGASPRPIADKKWFSNDSRIGWVRISDVSKSSKYLTKTEQYLSEAGIRKSRLVKQGNIIMSICATIGKPIYTNFDVCIHDGFVVFENLQIDHEYLYYYLMLIEKNWYQYGQPGSQVNLNSDIVSNETIPIPDIKEQTKIANFLTAVDEKISHLTQKHDLLTQYKKGVMQQIFSQELRFKDDDGQDFPEWEEHLLGNVATLFNGRAYKQAEWEVTGTPVIRLQNLTGSGDTYYYSNIKLPANQYCNAGDLLYMWSATFGPVWWQGGKAIYHYHIWKIETDKNKLSKNYLFYVLDDITAKMKRTSNGSTMAHITKGGMEKLALTLPSVAEQTKIANFLTAIDDKITAAQSQLKAVKQYKQGLLQQMFI